MKTIEKAEKNMSNIEVPLAAINQLAEILKNQELSEIELELEGQYRIKVKKEIMTTELEIKEKKQFIHEKLKDIDKRFKNLKIQNLIKSQFAQIHICKIHVSTYPNLKKSVIEKVKIESQI